MSHKIAAKGFTLIELMIGLVLCTLSILISLTLYSNLVQTSVLSRTDSRQDGQLASAIAAIQLEVQSAGYGVAVPNNTELKLVDDHHLNWRFTDANGTQCKGFWIDTDNNGVLKLQLMKSTAACTTTTDIANKTTANWSEVTQLAQFGITPPTITMALTNAACTPYGVGTAANHPVLTITAQSSVSRGAAAGAIAPDVYSFCIANITP